MRMGLIDGIYWDDPTPVGSFTSNSVECSKNRSTARRAGERSPHRNAEGNFSMHSILRCAAITIVGATMALPMALPIAAQGAAAAALPPDGTALVFVNTQAILPIAPGADSAQSRFQAVVTEFEAELAELAEQIDSMLADYRRQESLMGQAGREQKQQEILDLQRSAQQRQQELDAQSQQRRNELLAPILQGVTDVIEEIRAEHDYAIVFDIAESGVIAADNSLDITAAVLERLGVDSSVAAAGPGR